MAHVPTDTWLKEFEEAMRLAEDIGTRIRERDSIVGCGGDAAELVATTRRKITMLGTCLDRLESLLQNPPEKPRLDEEELYRRQDMLLGIRFKTKQMAASFCTSPPNRISRLGQKVRNESIEPSSSIKTVGLHRQIVKPLSTNTIAGSNHDAATGQVVLTVEEDAGLRARLLGKANQDAEVPVLKDWGAEAKGYAGWCSSRVCVVAVLGIVAVVLVIWAIAIIL